MIILFFLLSMARMGKVSKYLGERNEKGKGNDNGTGEGDRGGEGREGRGGWMSLISQIMKNGRGREGRKEKILVVK